jgi:sigma-E factor negative regulatory protein RseC
MIETRVRVLSTSNGVSLVESTEANGCSACSARSACGISGLGKVFDRRRKAVPIPGAARPGDELMLGIAESDLLKVGLLAYIVPALLAVLGAVGADLAGTGDLGAALSAFAGGALGLLISRYAAPTPRMTTQSIPLNQGDFS